jgi:hypothetical protein
MPITVVVVTQGDGLNQIAVKESDLDANPALGKFFKAIKDINGKFSSKGIALTELLSSEDVSKLLEYLNESDEVKTVAAEEFSKNPASFFEPTTKATRNPAVATVSLATEASQPTPTQKQRTWSSRLFGMHQTTKLPLATVQLIRTHQKYITDYYKDYACEVIKMFGVTDRKFHVRDTSSNNTIGKITTQQGKPAVKLECSKTADDIELQHLAAATVQPLLDAAGGADKLSSTMQLKLVFENKDPVQTEALAKAMFGFLKERGVNKDYVKVSLPANAGLQRKIMQTFQEVMQQEAGTPKPGKN